MKQLELIIRNPTGLHARPAKTFVQLAKQFESDIRIAHDKKRANAKSLLSVLTLGVHSGGVVRVRIRGKDEEEAAQAIEEAVRTGLDETENPLPETDFSASTAEDDRSPEVQGIEVAVKTKVSGDLNGIPASPGIAIGPIYQIKRTEIHLEEKFQSAALEKERLQKAFADAREQIKDIRGQMDLGEEEAAIFDVHLELMDDPDLIEAVESKIEEQQHSAGHVWKATIRERANLIAQLDDPLLAARAADLHDVGTRVLRALVGEKPDDQIMPDTPVILVADYLTPSDTATLDRDRVLGFCTTAGGPTSHSAIIARALGLPAVVSTGAKILTLENGTTLILNGKTGEITVNPDEDTLAKAHQVLADEQEKQKAAKKSAADPAITQDGHRVEVTANIGGLQDAIDANSAGAEGVGLLRTEFLFLERETAPTENEQVEVYKGILQALDNQPVILRTLDIGGDKPLPYINVDKEDNPFLGERGLRLALNQPELLHMQLRAALRAAGEGVLRIMFPMVADISEWRAARAIVQKLQKELNSPQVELGIMIEIPSAALVADVFATEVDFFSIGTNDLTQYALAVDRLHPKLSYLSDGLHPAVLRLIRTTVEAAHSKGKWVGLCGALGADPQAIPILVGLGVDELSVSVPSVAITKAQVRKMTLAVCKNLAEKALLCSTAAEVRNLNQ